MSVVKILKEFIRNEVYFFKSKRKLIDMYDSSE